MKSLLTIAVLSLLSGCTGAGNVYYVDSRFTPEETAVISAANDMWCTASRNARCMDLVFGARVDLNEVHRNAIIRSGTRAAQYRFPHWVEREQTAAFHHPAGTVDSDLIVVFFERVAPENLRVVVAHEMGHAHGVGDHLTDPNAIMYHDLAGAKNKEVVTCADLQAAGVTCELGE